MYMLSRIFIAFLFTQDNHLMGIPVNSIYFKEMVKKKKKPKNQKTFKNVSDGKNMRLWSFLMWPDLKNSIS